MAAAEVLHEPAEQVVVRAPNVPKLAVPPVSVRTSLDGLARLLGRGERPLGSGQHAPASVSTSRRRARANSATPSSASSLRIWSERLGWAM